MDDIPVCCIPCIQRLQAHCPHLHTSFWGGFHFSHGEVWDDITEICDDCGAHLSATQPSFNQSADKDPIPF